MKKEELSLQRAESSYWIFIIVFIIGWAVLQYTAVAYNFIHTYQLPVQNPGTLTSQRWDWPFVREWLFFLYLFIPFSGFFMLWTRRRLGVGVHLFLIILFIIWNLINLGFDIGQLTNKNLPPNDPRFDSTNLATDPRWCCIYGGQPGTERICCNDFNIATCPPIGVDDLATNSVFLIRFGYNIFLLALLFFDLLFTWVTWLPALNDFLNSFKNQ